MLTLKQVKAIREHLEKAQNPLFLFDNDIDGICSFLLLQRYIGRGKGFPVKSFPSLNESYFKKIEELKSDYVFILDKPVVSKEFFDLAEKFNIPVVWIDHHETKIKEIPAFVNYYNPLYNKSKKNEPVTALCYQITKQKKDLWLAIAGCVADKFLPKYYKEFLEKNPDLAIKSKDPFEILYRSEIGRIGRLFGFGLKDKTTNVINMIKFLMNVKGPYDVLEENAQTRILHKRFNELNSKYRKILEKAVDLEDSNEKVLFFKYGGDLSISADISNELSFMYTNKVIVVVYVNGSMANISIRGKKIRPKLLKAIEGLVGASGGGHEDAVGARISVQDIDLFKKRFITLVK
ncbi:MAG TPA: DHHA1 domain-containing protein [Candidatus Nanoarchaeia archaeon]|nr:DHHA1 domain-containing protein [Candidatus Nanoarchaeia archaeon]